MKTLKRRTFLRRAVGVGAGLSYFALHPDQIWEANAAFAADAAEEAKKAKLAKYTFTFSSPYITSRHVTTPHAHLEIKRLIEAYTKNKVHVIIHEGGIDGTGSALSNRVRYGKSQGALLSVANLVPLVSELDVLNIPFWSSSKSEYVRLFKSQAWDKHVLSKTAKHKLKVLFPYVVGARTATSTRKYGKLIKSPADFEGVKFRIPGSKSLAVFYKLTKAKPLKFAWNLTARTARIGRFQALDPSVIGLYSGPDNLREELGIISEIESVHDGWVAIGNTDFIASLDSETRTQFMDSMAEIQTEQVKLYRNSRGFCIEEFAKLGTKTYIPTPKERELLASSFGHSNPAWTPVKKRLLGEDGVTVFDKLFKVAKG